MAFSLKTTDSQWRGRRKARATKQTNQRRVVDHVRCARKLAKKALLSKYFIPRHTLRMTGIFPLKKLGISILRRLNWRCNRLQQHSSSYEKITAPNTWVCHCFRRKNVSKINTCLRVNVASFTTKKTRLPFTYVFLEKLYMRISSSFVTNCNSVLVRRICLRKWKHWFTRTLPYTKL